MYHYALVRQPGENFAEGLTTLDLGKPDYEKALQQHKLYCEALKSCGLELLVLPPDLLHPDGCFVEDTAIITERVVIITRPGNQTRRGEEETIARLLHQYRGNMTKVTAPATVDGGDVLRVGDHFYIGISHRTNGEGALQLSAILLKYGYTSSTIPVKTVLHLKTGVTRIDRERLISVQELSDHFRQFEVIEVDESERYAANCLLVNDFLLMTGGFPRAKQAISRIRGNIKEVEMSEFEKMEGGLTCLSLLF
ncbi:N(G),N(G)-dimethylarginine dimethylaminohydrolase [Candidatus Woesearchaeota archaeon]|nr:N(G),N(G)-dimethylarginine dimethylaminohydrolase [Candidatus Woesearchaeota archaeon]